MLSFPRLRRGNNTQPNWDSADKLIPAKKAGKQMQNMNAVQGICKKSRGQAEMQCCDGYSQKSVEILCAL